MGIFTSKTTLALLGVSVLLAVALAWVTQSLLEARSLQGATLARATASEALLQAERSWNNRLRREAQASREKWDASKLDVQAELDAVPEWGSTPVPAGVVAGLCKHISCAPPRATEAPVQAPTGGPHE